MLIREGSRFGSLTVVRNDYGQSNMKRFVVRCDCGYSGMIVRTNALLRPDGVRACPRCRKEKASS